MSSVVLDPESPPLVGAGPGQAFVRFVANAFRLRGRASRSEYWWWMLINLVVVALAQFVLPWLIENRLPQPALLFGPFGPWLAANITLFSVAPTAAPQTALAAGILIACGLWLLVTLIPGYTVAVRRLHDSNLSGWWVLLVLLPVGALIVLLLTTRRSRPEGARFD
ncbi:DUF805 domain-containing protein [Microbacterium sp. TNHR37B]|uniref:DUF805 domain-containing protein n=1 Tax=Microbacterium sp. TNHR37B TaxID=1775956 RepID=UPI0007B2C42C|nr:DUF805 domain-containing protein [Microbacterium sp. TNHR37B]KZE91527.1 Inner membrane protein YhaH [Microbacterium sp. TNHR37B]